MRLSQIKKILNAELFGKDIDIEGVSTDTRTLTQGNLFVALKGENFDGHDFIPQALEKGATALLVDQKNRIPPGVSALLVSDSLDALAKLASFHRKQFQIPCIGITGSCGKTTVKGMVGDILSLGGPTLVTKGNLNNHIGLPLTLLKLNAEHKAMVIEMGASALLEIAFLGKIAKPTIALINNAHPAHIEGFGSLDGVVKAKGEIYEALDEDGIAILNIESPHASFWKKLIGERKTITYGFNTKAMIRAEDFDLEPLHSSFRVVTQTYQGMIHVSLPGEHNVMNALAAIACVYPLHTPLAIIQEALKNFKGAQGRMIHHSLKGGIELIDDTYNSNPKAIEEALKVLTKLPGEKLLILGDMAELGANSPRLHKEAGELVKQYGIQRLWAVGPLGQNTIQGFGEKGRWFSNKADLLAELVSLNSPMTILIKGSRSAKMESLVQSLCQKG